MECNEKEQLRRHGRYVAEACDKAHGNNKRKGNREGMEEIKQRDAIKKA